MEFALEFTPDLLIAFLTLFFLPTLRMGPGNDIVMRGGIPALMLVCILVVAHFRQASWNSPASLALGLLLVVGSLTPFQEILRAISLPAWKIDLNANLVSASRGTLPPHYVARLNQPGLSWMMQQPSPVPGTRANEKQ